MPWVASSERRKDAVMTGLPIACTLTPEALRTRREGLLMDHHRLRRAGSLTPTAQRPCGVIPSYRSPAGADRRK